MVKYTASMLAAANLLAIAQAAPAQPACSVIVQVITGQGIWVPQPDPTWGSWDPKAPAATTKATSTWADWEDPSKPKASTKATTSTWADWEDPSKPKASTKATTSTWADWEDPSKPKATTTSTWADWEDPSKAKPTTKTTTSVWSDWDPATPKPTSKTTTSVWSDWDPATPKPTSKTTSTYVGWESWSTSSSYTVKETTTTKNGGGFYTQPTTTDSTTAAPTTTEATTTTTTTTESTTTTTTTTTATPEATTCGNFYSSWQYTELDNVSAGGSCGNTFTVNCGGRVSTYQSATFWQRADETIESLSECLAICDDNDQCTAVVWTDYEGARAADYKHCWQTANLDPVDVRGGQGQYGQISYKNGGSTSCSSSYINH